MEQKCSHCGKPLKPTEEKWCYECDKDGRMEALGGVAAGCVMVVIFGTIFFLFFAAYIMGNV